MNSRGKRSSILKKRLSVDPGSLEASPSEATSTAKAIKRIGFKPKKSVKEFLATDETATIWGNSYEVSTDATPPSLSASDETTMKDISRGNVSLQSNNGSNKENVIAISEERRTSSEESSGWNLSISVCEEERRRLKADVTINTSVLNTTDRLSQIPSAARSVLRSLQSEQAESIAMDVSPAKNTSANNSPRKTIYYHPKQNLFVSIDEKIPNENSSPKLSPNDTDLNFFGPSGNSSSQRQAEIAASKILFQTSNASNPFRNKSIQTEPRPSMANKRSVAIDGDLSGGWSSQGPSTGRARSTFYNSNFEISDAWNSHPAAALKLKMMQQGLLDQNADPRLSEGDVPLDVFDSTIAISRTVAQILGPSSSRPTSLECTRQEAEAMDFTEVKENSPTQDDMETSFKEENQGCKSAAASITQNNLEPIVLDETNKPEQYSKSPSRTNGLSRARPSFVPRSAGMDHSGMEEISVEEVVSVSGQNRKPNSKQNRDTILKPVPVDQSVFMISPIRADQHQQSIGFVEAEHKFLKPPDIVQKTPPPPNQFGRQTVYDNRQMDESTVNVGRENVNLDPQSLVQMEKLDMGLPKLVFRQTSIGLDLDESMEIKTVEPTKPKIHRLAPRGLNMDFVISSAKKDENRVSAGRKTTNLAVDISVQEESEGKSSEASKRQTSHRISIIDLTRTDSPRVGRKTEYQSLDVSMESPDVATKSGPKRITFACNESINQSVSDKQDSKKVLRPTMLFNEQLDQTKTHVGAESSQIDLVNRKTVHDLRDVSIDEEPLYASETNRKTINKAVKIDESYVEETTSKSIRKTDFQPLDISNASPCFENRRSAEFPRQIRKTILSNDAMDFVPLESPKKTVPVSVKHRGTSYNIGEMEQTVANAYETNEAPIPQMNARRTIYCEENMDKTCLDNGVSFSKCATASTKRETIYGVESMEETQIVPGMISRRASEECGHLNQSLTTKTVAPSPLSFKTVLENHKTRTSSCEVSDDNILETDNIPKLENNEEKPRSFRRTRNTNETMDCVFLESPQSSVSIFTARRGTGYNLGEIEQTLRPACITENIFVPETNAHRTIYCEDYMDKTYQDSEENLLQCAPVSKPRETVYGSEMEQTQTAPGAMSLHLEQECKPLKRSSTAELGVELSFEAIPNFSALDETDPVIQKTRSSIFGTKENAISKIQFPARCSEGTESKSDDPSNRSEYKQNFQQSPKRESLLNETPETMMRRSTPEFNKLQLKNSSARQVAIQPENLCANDCEVSNILEITEGWDKQNLHLSDNTGKNSHRSVIAEETLISGSKYPTMNNISAELIEETIAHQPVLNNAESQFGGQIDKSQFLSFANEAVEASFDVQRSPSGESPNQRMTIFQPLKMDQSILAENAIQGSGVHVIRNLHNSSSEKSRQTVYEVQAIDETQIRTNDEKTIELNEIDSALRKSYLSITAKISQMNASLQRSQKITDQSKNNRQTTYQLDPMEETTTVIRHSVIPQLKKSQRQTILAETDINETLSCQQPRISHGQDDVDISMEETHFRCQEEETEQTAACEDGLLVVRRSDGTNCVVVVSARNSPADIVQDVATPDRGDRVDCEMDEHIDPLSGSVRYSNEGKINFGRKTILAPLDMDQSLIQESTTDEPKFPDRNVRRTLIKTENINVSNLQMDPLDVSDRSLTDIGLQSNMIDDKTKRDFSFAMPQLPDDCVLRSSAMVPSLHQRFTIVANQSSKNLIQGSQVQEEQVNFTDVSTLRRTIPNVLIPAQDLSEISQVAECSQVGNRMNISTFKTGDLSSLVLKEVSEPPIEVPQAISVSVIQETPRKISMIPIRRSRASLFAEPVVDPDELGVTAMDCEENQLPGASEQDPLGLLVTLHREEANTTTVQSPSFREQKNSDGSTDEVFYDAETSQENDESDLEECVGTACEIGLQNRRKRGSLKFTNVSEFDQSKMQQPMLENKTQIFDQSEFTQSMALAENKTLKFIDVNALEQTTLAVQKRNLSRISKTVLVESEHDPLNVSLSEDYPEKKRKTSLIPTPVKRPEEGAKSGKKSTKRVTFHQDLMLSVIKQEDSTVENDQFERDQSNAQLELENVNIKEENYNSRLYTNEAEPSRLGVSVLTDPSVFMLEENDMLANESNISLVESPKVELKFDNTYYRDYANLTINLDEIKSTSCIVISDDSTTEDVKPKITSAAELTVEDLPKRIRNSRKSMELNSSVASEVMFELRQQMKNSNRSCCSFKGNCNCKKRRTMAIARRENLEVIQLNFTENFDRILGSVSHIPVQQLPLNEQIQEIVCRVTKPLPLPCLDRPKKMFPETPPLWFLLDNRLKSPRLDEPSNVPRLPCDLPKTPSVTELICNKLLTEKFRWKLDYSLESSKQLTLLHRTLRTVTFRIRLRRPIDETSKTDDVRIDRIELVECWPRTARSTRQDVAHMELVRLFESQRTVDRLCGQHPSISQLMSLIVELNSMTEQVFETVDRLYHIVRNNGARICCSRNSGMLEITKYFHFKTADSVDWNKAMIKFPNIHRIDCSSVSFHRPFVNFSKLFPTEQQCGRIGVSGIGFLECFLWNIEKNCMR
ncbi:uncharacterized protein LOC129746758 [Uranotaenia lowii]|uniref:uncharacterized protein LOC129746758 n=1 Tax=Uranotaenia lowii TaxID=190385 RepID=UPI00247AB943|nr:uncharacterized protein LOC129746758 [Uranotaenia lowii]